ncbi:MAG: hypothetical protein E6H58_08685 [Betaproteobacteria bacterium]|nr:MAG: hypothetical protein E6H58_08685 [Betaproteobacteria bacterium]
MAQTLRAVNVASATSRRWLIPAFAFAAPLLAALWFGTAQAIEASAWSRLFADSQFVPALCLGLWVGVAAWTLSLAIVLRLVPRLHGTPTWIRIESALGARSSPIGPRRPTSRACKTALGSR